MSSRVCAATHYSLGRRTGRTTTSCVSSTPKSVFEMYTSVTSSGSSPSSELRGVRVPQRQPGGGAVPRLRWVALQPTCIRWPTAAGGAGLQASSAWPPTPRRDESYDRRGRVVMTPSLATVRTSIKELLLATIHAAASPAAGTVGGGSDVVPAVVPPTRALQRPLRDRHLSPDHLRQAYK